MPGLLGYDPLRLGTLATSAQAAADDLTAVAGDEPFVVDAVGVCHGIAADLDETLLTALRAVLTSTAMTEWNGSALLSVDALIAALTQQAVAAQAADPSAPFVLGPGEFSLATAIRAGEQAQWLHDVNPACLRFAGGSYVGGGYVTDPNGDRWPIVVSRVVTEDGDVYTADEVPVSPGDPSVSTLGGSDPGWEVVGYATGIERFQEAPSAVDKILGALGGSTGQVGPLPPNSGLAYIAIAPSGPPHLVSEPVTPGPVVAPPNAIIPDPADSSPATVVDGGAALAVTVGQGGVMAAAMDNQTQRAYRAVFEENADGRRRVRIETFTLANDGEGDVVIIPEHVYVDADGGLMSETISYGAPYETNGVQIGAANDDVAEFAFSGNEPMSYRVPQAVFP